MTDTIQNALDVLRLMQSLYECDLIATAPEWSHSLRQAVTDLEALTQRPAAQKVDDLHAAIMNLPCDGEMLDWANTREAYQYGHKYARHAAAELVLAHATQQATPDNAAEVARLKAVIDELERREIRSVAQQATPEPLSDQDATLLNQAHDMLLEHADDQRRKGNDSHAAGAECSADAVLRLAAQAAAATPEPEGEAVAFALVRKTAIRALGAWSAVCAGEIDVAKTEAASKAEKEFWAALESLHTLYTRPAPGVPMTDASRDVLAERQRQITAEGWTPEHDDEHDKGELAVAAAIYALRYRGADPPLWVTSGDRPDYASRFLESVRRWVKSGSTRTNLVKAGALILAEIERLDRAAAQAKGVQA